VRHLRPARIHGHLRGIDSIDGFEGVRDGLGTVTTGHAGDTEFDDFCHDPGSVPDALRLCIR